MHVTKASRSNVGLGMNKQETKKLEHGLYRLYWKDGGSSLAAVGSSVNGDRWIAPINWINVGTTLHWKLVDRAELLMPKYELSGARRASDLNGGLGNERIKNMIVFDINITCMRRAAILKAAHGEKRPGGIGVLTALEKAGVMEWKKKPICAWELTLLGKEIANILAVPNAEITGSACGVRVD